MGKVVGHRGKNVLFVSDSKCVSKNTDCIGLPPEFDNIPNDSIMRDYVVWKGGLIGKNEIRQAKDLRVAFISNYKMACGIATYSEWLYAAVTPLVGDYKIFAERRDDQEKDADPKVVRCWKRGEAVGDLVRLVHEYNPDVVLIQHEYGLWPNARIWLSLMTQLSRFRVVTTLHSVYKNHYDKIVCESAIPEIVVHTNAGHEVLKSHGIQGRVTVIPHGSLPPQPEPKPWNMYASEKTYCQFGFGFKYKGWEQSIQLAAKLKEKHPDVFFTGVFSESQFSKHFHNAYFAELEDLVAKLGVQENVGLIRGFMDEKILMHVLRMNRLAVFPYIENGEHTVYGCSGAARVAMRACIPVIASGAPLFDDLEGVVRRVRTMDELCEEAATLLNSPQRWTEQVSRQLDFLKRTSWEKVAAAYVDLFCRPGP